MRIMKSKYIRAFFLIPYADICIRAIKKHIYVLLPILCSVSRIGRRFSEHPLLFSRSVTQGSSITIVMGHNGKRKYYSLLNSDRSSEN